MLRGKPQRSSGLERAVGRGWEQFPIRRPGTDSLTEQGILRRTLREAKSAPTRFSEPSSSQWEQQVQRPWGRRLTCARVSEEASMARAGRLPGSISEGTRGDQKGQGCLYRPAGESLCKRALRQLCGQHSSGRPPTQFRAESPVTGWLRESRGWQK